MNYPQQLLPQLTFKKITANLSNFFVCRKVIGINSNFSRSQIPPEDFLGIEKASDCFDYSTNLPGIFELDHNKLDLIGPNKAHFRRYWDWASEVTVPIYEQDFIVNDSIEWFYFQIGKVQQLEIPFNRKVSTPPNEIAKAVIVHTPSNCNFWHFSIKWRDSNGEISVSDSKWKNSIIALIRSLLSEIYQDNYSGQVIPDEYYKKN